MDLVVRAPAGAVGITGLVDSGNISTDNLAAVVGGEFTGGLTPITNIAISDIRWDFQSNAGISDSISDALLAFDGNALQTDIEEIDTPVKINAVWVCERESRFTCTTDGRATFIAERNDFFPVDISIGLISVGGTPIDSTTYLAKNGSVIANSGRSLAISGADPRTISIPWQVEMSKDDYLEVFVENNTNGTNDIIAESAILRVR